MGKFRESTILAMAQPHTLEIIKRTRFDMEEILEATKDISGTPIPADLKLNLRSTHWDFCLHKESSWGMEFTVESRYGPNLDCLIYLCYKFPDLRMRLTFRSYDTDGFFDLVFIARTRNGKVETQEAYWDEDLLSGCGFCGEPEFYTEYKPGVYLTKGGYHPCLITDDEVEEIPAQITQITGKIIYMKKEKTKISN